MATEECVSDISLLRTRFILTGVLTLAPLVLALVWGIYAAAMSRAPSVVVVFRHSPSREIGRHVGIEVVFWFSVVATTVLSVRALSSRS